MNFKPMPNQYLINADNQDGGRYNDTARYGQKKTGNTGIKRKPSFCTLLSVSEFTMSDDFSQYYRAKPLSAAVLLKTPF